MAPLQKDEHDEKFALERNRWQGMDEASRMRRRAIDQVEEQSRLQRQGRTSAPEDAERTRHDEDQAGATEANTSADGSSDSFHSFFKRGIVARSMFLLILCSGFNENAVLYGPANYHL